MDPGLFYQTIMLAVGKVCILILSPLISMVEVTVFPWLPSVDSVTRVSARAQSAQRNKQNATGFMDDLLIQSYLFLVIPAQRNTTSMPAGR